MDGNTVIVIFAAGADVCPATFLLLKIQTSGVRHKEHVNEDTSKTEPWYDPETRLGRPIAVTDSGGQGAQFANSGRHTVGSGSDGHRVNLSGRKEGDTVGAELLEEGRQEVHGLELLDMGFRGVVFELSTRDDEEEKVHEEAESHHVLAAIKLVVDQETCEVVPTERNADIDQVVKPPGHDGRGFRADDFDKLVLEQLVSGRKRRHSCTTYRRWR